MKLQGVKPSDNLVNRMDDTPAQAFLTGILMNLDPMAASRKIYGKMIERGIIEVPGTDELLAKIQQEIQVKKSPKQR